MISVGYFNRQLGRYYVYVDGRDVPRARLIMQEHLGRALVPGEVVHHINGVATDDRVENLAVLSDSEHKRLHAREARAKERAQWTHDWTRDHAACVACGTTERKHAGKGLCHKCYWHHRRKTQAEVAA